MDTDLQKLNPYRIQGWLHKKDEVEQSMKHYWGIRNELAMIDGIVMKSSVTVLACTHSNIFLTHGFGVQIQPECKP